MQLPVHEFAEMGVSHGLIPSELSDCLGLILGVRKKTFASVVRNCPPFLHSLLSMWFAGRHLWPELLVWHHSATAAAELRDTFASCMQQ